MVSFHEIWHKLKAADVLRLQNKEASEIMNTNDKALSLWSPTEDQQASN